MKKANVLLSRLLTDFGSDGTVIVTCIGVSSLSEFVSCKFVSGSQENSRCREEELAIYGGILY